MDDLEKPNYAVPEALATVGADNPETLAALFRGIKNPDGIVSGSAIEALLKVAPQDPKVTSMVFKADEAGDS